MEDDPQFKTNIFIDFSFFLKDDQLNVALNRIILKFRLMNKLLIDKILLDFGAGNGLLSGNSVFVLIKSDACL